MREKPSAGSRPPVNSRQAYLRKRARNRRAVRLTQIALVLALLILWEWAADSGRIDAFIVSSPSRIWNMLRSMAGAGLARHIWVTTYETLAGFLIGVVLGLALAVGMWFSEFARKVSGPYLAVLGSLPKIALGPVIIVWAGAGMRAIIVMAVAISLIVTVMELSTGFAGTPRNLLVTLESFGATRWQCFCKAVLPWNLPVLFQSLKVNMGLSLVGVIAGEFLVSRAGLGYLIVYAGQVFRMDLVMLSVILLGILAFLMYAAVARAEKWVNRWVNHSGD